MSPSLPAAAGRSVQETRMPGWAAAILLAVMLISVNGAVLFAGRSLIPMTSTPGVVPRAPYGYQGLMPTAPTALDPFASYCANFAYDAYTVNTLREGTLPYWNPYQGLGQPLLSNGFSALFYPINWLRLVLPPAWWDMVYLANWFLAALFLYLYLGLMGVGTGPSLVAASAVMANGYFPAFLALREVAGVAAWWPLLLYGVERAVREPFWRARHWVIALGVYCTNTAGQPEVAFLSLFAALLYALVRLVGAGSDSRWRAFRALVPGSVAGLLVAAPGWVNFAAYAFTQHTLHTPENQYGSIHLPFQYLATYVFPYLYGLLLIHPYGWLDDWIYDLSPGWFPAVGLFACLVSIAAWRQGNRRATGFLLASAGIMMGKIWGVPVIAWLGRLPLFDRVFFAKFGGFLPALAFSALTAYGLAQLAGLEARKWKPWLIAWWTLATAVFVMGVVPLADRLEDPLQYPEARATLATFGGLGFGWVILGPACLWWFRRRHPEAGGMFYALAAAGMLLQGMACGPHGYDRPTYLGLGAVCLGLYVLFALVLGFRGGIRLRPWLAAVLWAPAVLLPLMIAQRAPSGPPSRYDPLTRAPYLDRLAGLQEGNLYRSYSLDGTPQPNFACPYKISSLGIVEAVAPLGADEFMKKLLDRASSALWFGGNHTAGRENYGVTALQELHRHRRYFQFAAVRYLVTTGGDPNAISYERFGPRRAVPLYKPVEAWFTCPVDGLSEIQVMFGTYGRKNPGVVTVSLSGADGALLRRSERRAESIRNNEFEVFEFEALTGVKGKDLLARVEFRPDTPEGMIAAWETKDIWAASFVFRVTDPERPFRLIHEDGDGIRIWEDREANPRVFLAPEAKVVRSGAEAMQRMQETEVLTRLVWLEEGPEKISVWPMRKETGRSLDFRLDPNEVRVRYEAYTSGVLTLVDSYMPGWRATVNGRASPVLRVNGVFRGIRIETPGAYEIHFRYRPEYWGLTLALAGIGLILLVGASCWGSEGMRLQRFPPFGKGGLGGIS